jgi:hypothetical protein
VAFSNRTAAVSRSRPRRHTHHRRRHRRITKPAFTG